MNKSLTEIKNDLKQQMGDRETMQMLLNTTFKGLSEAKAKMAAMEAVMRGFQFKDFLEKNVYAIPFKGEYSLVTSIDYARKVGMRSGVVGVSEPIYEEDENGKIISCTITVKRKFGDYVGDYTAKVYFDEFNTGYNLWKSKPRIMIAKVAEMHALRKACPEELSQHYTEEEFQMEAEKELNLFETLKEKIETASKEELETIKGNIESEETLLSEQEKSDLKDLITLKQNEETS
ncbi:recombinase RecT [Persephonella sp.]